MGTGAAVTAAERAACRGFEDEHGCVEDELHTDVLTSGEGAPTLEFFLFGRS